MTLECIRQGKDGVYVDIHVVPGSKKEGADYDAFGKRLRLKIRAPAVDGKANKGVIEYFSGIFGVCVLASGPASRKKTVFIPGMAYSEVLGRLEEKVGD
ncbi:MAG: DUF167 family protein [Candidatus Altiarchaeia archaeon]|jgi:hypothetical protein